MMLDTNATTPDRGRAPEPAMLKHVALYSDGDRVNALRKEDLIYGSIGHALEAMPDVECRRRAAAEADASASPCGLVEVRMRESLVALGRAAHTTLADYRKRTLIAGHDDEDTLDEDLERLVWSCVNTTKIVALGRSAWRSVQMLPVDERRFFETPPLRMPQLRGLDRPGEIAREVLVINHEEENTRARGVCDTLARGGYAVQRAGCGEEDWAKDDGWNTEAPIHVHVGFHDASAEEVRLLDTWASGRFAILLLPPRSAHAPPPGSLMVDAEVNGFVCVTAERVLSACDDLHVDAVLRKKMLRAGAASVAPLNRTWLDVATELVA